MKKVLIVEDEYLLSFVHSKFLKNKGFDVTCANNGIEAIEAARSTTFDVILMDIRIKGDMDGIDTMMEIQKFCITPVIYSTGNSENSVRNRAKKTNVKGFLIKPVNLDDLADLLNTI